MSRWNSRYSCVSTDAPSIITDGPSIVPHNARKLHYRTEATVSRIIVMHRWTQWRSISSEPHNTCLLDSFFLFVRSFVARNQPINPLSFRFQLNKFEKKRSIDEGGVSRITLSRSLLHHLRDRIPPNGRKFLFISNSLTFKR